MEVTTVISEDGAYYTNNYFGTLSTKHINRNLKHKYKTVGVGLLGIPTLIKNELRPLPLGWLRKRGS